MTISRLFSLVFIFIICWCGYYLYDPTPDDNGQVLPSAEAPIFTGMALVNSSYDDKGIRNYKIYSDKLEHYSQKEETLFDNPRLVVYRDGSTEEWVVTAKTGILSKTNILTLNGDVLLDNQIQNPNFDTLSTEKITINLKTKLFSSDTPVYIVGLQFVNRGNAIEGNFDTNVSTLFNKVQGIYEKPKP